MSDRTDQGRALVADLEHRARIRGYGLEGQAAEWLSWALDRIAALEGALRSGVDGLSQGSCFTCGAEPGSNVDCPGCEWIAKAECLLTESSNV